MKHQRLTRNASPLGDRRPNATKLWFLKSDLAGRRKWLLASRDPGARHGRFGGHHPQSFPVPRSHRADLQLQRKWPDRRKQGNAFFQSLGTNGRSCGTCHLASDGFGLGVTSIREKFAATHGNDPLFAAIDGANCPNWHFHDRASHSLLLKSGLIRIFLPVPANAQYQIQAERDPLRLRGRHRRIHWRADGFGLSPAVADHELALSQLSHV